MINLNERPATTSAEDNPSVYDCFGTYSSTDTGCEGGVDASGRKVKACKCRIPCRNIDAINNAQNVIRAESLVVRSKPSAPQQGQTIPVHREDPPSLIAPRGSPQPSRGGMAAAPAEQVSRRQVVTAEGGAIPAGVLQQPHVRGRSGVLMAKESRKHSKKKRLAAEVTRAGVSAAVAAIGQQISAFISAVPMLDEGEESDYLQVRNTNRQAPLGAQGSPVLERPEVHQERSHAHGPQG